MPKGFFVVTQFHVILKKISDLLMELPILKDVLKYVIVEAMALFVMIAGVLQMQT